MKPIYPGSPVHPATIAKQQVVKVSQSAYELLEDLRMAILEFAAAVSAADVEQKYVNMEMRRRELSVYVSSVEKWQGTEQSVVMQF